MKDVRLEQSKACSRCKQVQPLLNFTKIARKPGKYVSECKPCRAKLSAEFRINKPDKAKEYRKNYEVSHREYFREKSRKRRAANPEKMAASYAEWYKKNPESRVKRRHEYRARKYSNGVFVVSKKEIVKLRSGACFYCGSRTNIQIDHVIPVSRGGRHSVGNLVSACSQCNQRKNQKFITEWNKCRSTSAK